MQPQQHIHIVMQEQLTELKQKRKVTSLCGGKALEYRDTISIHDSRINYMSTNIWKGGATTKHWKVEAQKEEVGL